MFKLTVKGNLCKDVEVCSTKGKDSKQYIKGRLGIPVGGSRNDDDEYVSRSTFKPFTYFTQYADALAEHLTKGTGVMITGSMGSFMATNDDDEEEVVESISVDKMVIEQKIDYGTKKGKGSKGSSKKKKKKRSGFKDTGDFK